MHLLTLFANADDNSTTGGLLGMLPLLLLPLVAYFLLIRPNRRRMREQQDLQAGLDVGDEIVTSSGIYGFITGFDGDRVWVEVDDDVQLRVARAAIQGKVDAAASGTGTADEAARPEPPGGSSTAGADTTTTTTTADE